ncbi:NlpC/P60 family protein [Burkholderia anthina]|uniref:NlpC/P60 family protein n=1 Tax=Burkholderia anthina TaxID=179879 RepID=UPI00158E68C8|nr:NlpC/P60 family protein [Burkholderia anthina]
MRSDEINRYVGLPWADGARGPDAFDCWGLLAWIQREHFGIVLPDRSVDPEVMRGVYRMQIEKGRWRTVECPHHGCGVLLRGGDRPHVGVYLSNDGGGVLHSSEGIGVVFTLKRHIGEAGYARATWYEFL